MQKSTSLKLVEQEKKKSFNFSRIISHFGFGLLIFFIAINHIFSVEKNFNIKLGEVKETKNYLIKFINFLIFLSTSFISILLKPVNTTLTFLFLFLKSG